MSDNETIINRLFSYIQSKKISIAKFERSIGAGNNYLNNVKSIGSDKLLAISKCYQDLNLEWLIKGEGDMIKSINIGHTSNGDYSPITGNIEVNNFKNQLEKALIRIEYLEKIIKDKEKIIELLSMNNK